MFCRFLSFLYVFLLISQPLWSLIELGCERFFSENLYKNYQGKKIALLTNQTGVNKKLELTFQKFYDCADIQLVALFAPEHGLMGGVLSGDHVKQSLFHEIPVYSLYGAVRKPSKEMMSGIDIIFIDLQDIGSRSYTFISTVFLVLEAAAENHVQVVILDRPNPINGHVVDGNLLENSIRSFVGYANLPYCHGMTVGELAYYFADEYSVPCNLSVITMKNWTRTTLFKDTGLSWIPTSPYIPEGDTPYYYAATGIIGSLNFVNIGIGYTLPFKLIGAPWIDPEALIAALQKHNLPGIHFFPCEFSSFYGKFKGENCFGVQLIVTDPLRFEPVTTQYTLLGVLFSLYPKQFSDAVDSLPDDRRLTIHKVCGTKQIADMILTKDKRLITDLVPLAQKEKEHFLKKRRKYLLY